MGQKSILIIGIFWTEKTKNKFAKHAPDQLADAFISKNIPVIRTSFYINRFVRIIDTVVTIIFKSTKYDIAIVPWFNGTGSFYWQEIASRLLKFLNKKIIIVMHGGGLPDLIDSAPGKYIPTLQRANAIVSPSGFIIERLKKHGVHSILVENILDLSRYPFIEKELFDLNLLWMRTFEEIYNPAMALKVVKILKQKNYQVKLYMAGLAKDKKVFNQIQQTVSEWDLTSEVIFTGYADEYLKKELANTCDMYLCTNRVDNAPVSVIEMMCFGLPVISTNVGGLPYFITNDHNGCLVPNEDAEAMADRIVELHITPSLGKKIALNGYYFSRKFGTDKVIEKWLKLFDDLTNNRTLTPQIPEKENVPTLKKQDRIPNTVVNQQQ